MIRIILGLARAAKSESNFYESSWHEIAIGQSKGAEGVLRCHAAHHFGEVPGKPAHTKNVLPQQAQLQNHQNNQAQTVQMSFPHWHYTHAWSTLLIQLESELG